MTVYRAAIVGCGRMGGFIDDEITWAHSAMLPYSHAASFAQSPRTELVAACEPNEEKLRAWGERYGVDALYTDIGEMMAEQSPDIVSVCTPTATRREATIEVAAGRPKAIFLEKPLSENLREADEMIAACEAAGARTAVNTSRRWHPIWHRASEVIARGEIGRVRTAVVYGVAGLSHNGSHLIDTMRHLLHDDVEWVAGHVHEGEGGAGEDDWPGMALLHLKGGGHVYLNTVDPSVTSFEIDVVGEKGRVRVSANGLEAELFTTGPTLANVGLTQQPFPRPVDIQATGLNAVADICQALDEGRETRCTIHDGRAALEIALAIRESHRRGGARVELPIADYETRIKAP